MENRIEGSPNLYILLDKFMFIINNLLFILCFFIINVL